MAIISALSSSTGSTSATTASSLFGPATADSLFAAGNSASVTPDQQSARAIIDAHRRDINRIRGYKTVLTPTEKARLVELQDKISKIESKSGKGTARADELDDRRDFIAEADRIIGKPIVDVVADAKLAEYNALKVALLEPNLDRATAKRVAFLERFKDSIEREIADNPGRISLIPKFQSAARQLNSLKPLRAPSQLSPAARKAYDDVVELINDHAGVKIELTARESDRVAALQASITNFQGSLGADISQQPTPQAVSRAYTRLSRA